MKRQAHLTTSPTPRHRRTGEGGECSVLGPMNPERASSRCGWWRLRSLWGGGGRVRNRPLNQHRKYRATAAEVLFIIEQTTTPPPPSHLTLLLLLSTAVRLWTAVVSNRLRYDDAVSVNNGNKSRDNSEGIG